LVAEPEDASSYAVERFDPGDGGPIMAYEHIHRYAACADIVRGKRVLDVACGEGYGAALIARTATRVIGADIDADVVLVAEKRYGHDGLEFLHADMFELPFEDHSFDVVTCFEAIEHVSTPGRALDEIARVLAPGGTVVISTPDKAVYSDAAHYENEFHLHEFYRDEFVDELHKRFSNVSLMGQRIRAGSELVALDSPPEPRSTIVSYLPDPSDAGKIELSPPLYLIAVCRDGDDADGGAELPAGVLLDGSDRLIDEYIATVHGAAAFAADTAQKFAETEQRIAELSALATRHETESAQRAAELLQANVELVAARAYAVEIARQYELSSAKERELGDELLRVARESEERAVYLLAVEEQLARLTHGDASA
jgi:SAM-dependent methyltransferase